MFFPLRKINASFQNSSRKGSLGNLKWLFFGTTFILKSVKLYCIFSPIRMGLITILITQHL